MVDGFVLDQLTLGIGRGVMSPSVLDPADAIVEPRGPLMGFRR